VPGTFSQAPFLGSDEIRIMGFFYLGMPIVTAAVGFGFIVFGAWLNNLLAGLVGGFEVYVKYVDPP
jgi:hypothetical protein